MPHWIRFLLLSLGAAGLAPAYAAEFAAALVTRDRSGIVEGVPGRLYVSGQRVRIETPDISPGYFLIDDGKAMFVRPGQRTYTPARGSTPLTQIFVPVDAGNPCAAWRAAAIDAGAWIESQWRCTRENKNANLQRAAVEYAVAPSKAAPSSRWVDGSLGFPTRFRVAAASISLENIELGPQPAELFELPASYRKLDAEALLQRIKQSDAWVEPPR